MRDFLESGRSLSTRLSRLGSVVAEDLPEPTSAKGDVAEFLEPVNCEGEKDGDEGGGETVCDGAVVETD